MDVVDLLLRAARKRADALPGEQTNAVRLFHGAADGLEGLVVERFDDVLIAQLFPGRRLPGEAELTRALERLRRSVGARAVYRKIFVSDRAGAPPEVALMQASAQPWLGEAVDGQICVVENGLRFMVHPYDGFSVGLFLEHRENRARVRAMAKGLRVLNAFSYTCAFSVAAAAGGAVSVSSVDLSRHYLEWGKQNFHANGMDTQGHWFFCSDVQEFYARARRQQRRYDMIVLDPPTFGRARRPQRAFVLEEQIGALLGGALELLEPEGIILLSTNARQIGLDRLEREMRAAGGTRGCTIMDRPELPVDFAGDPDYSKSIVARFS